MVAGSCILRSTIVLSDFCHRIEGSQFFLTRKAGSDGIKPGVCFSPGSNLRGGQRPGGTTTMVPPPVLPVEPVLPLAPVAPVLP